MKAVEQITRIRDFVTPLGFCLVEEGLRQETFIPGVRIDPDCRVVFDPLKLVQPGDLLHEIGHLAIIPDQFRRQVSGDVDTAISTIASGWFEQHEFMVRDEHGHAVECPVGRGLLQAGECEAMAWSYAAAIACGVPVTSVFHAKGYGGGHRDVITGFQWGAHVGINGLAAGGMCKRREFPAMLRWVQT